MALEDTIKQLKRADLTDIVNLNADWTTCIMSLGENHHLGVHLWWDNVAVTGTLYIDYSCDIAEDQANFDDTSMPTITTVALNGTFQEYMFLDKDIPVASFRIRFVHTSATANLKARIVRKGR
jgi:hypothetical protein